jgi:hypothetical protein
VAEPARGTAAVRTPAGDVYSAELLVVRPLAPPTCMHACMLLLGAAGMNPEALCQPFLATLPSDVAHVQLFISIHYLFHSSSYYLLFIAR